jgi:hypothetical protein
VNDTFENPNVLQPGSQSSFEVDPKTELVTLIAYSVTELVKPR